MTFSWILDKAVKAVLELAFYKLKCVGLLWSGVNTAGGLPRPGSAHLRTSTQSESSPLFTCTLALTDDGQPQQTDVKLNLIWTLLE